MNGPTLRSDSTTRDGFADFLQSLNTTVAPANDVSIEDEIASEDLNSLLLSGADPLGDSVRSVTASLVHNEIKTCFGCEAQLGLPALRAGDRPETWRCTGCGAIFLTGSTFDSVSGIQNAERAFRDITVPVDKLPTHEPENLEQLVKKLAGADYVGEERRASPRYPISLPATGMPLDENHQSARGAVNLTLRDISLEGLSLFSDMPLPHPFLLVDMTPGGFMGAQIVIEIRRNRPLGLMHEIAGTFV